MSACQGLHTGHRANAKKTDNRILEMSPPPQYRDRRSSIASPSLFSNSVLPQKFSPPVEQSLFQAAFSENFRQCLRETKNLQKSVVIFFLYLGVVRCK